MGTLYRAKSENFWAAAAVGAPNQWIHIDAGTTGRITIVQTNLASTVTTNAVKPIILQGVTINSSGSSGSFTVTDSGRGIIANLKSSVAEKDYHYNVPLRGNLLLDTNGSDVTISYIRD